MAMMDDTSFLISHIRNSFITSDDNWMCEAIIDCDDAVERQPTGVDKRPTTWHAGYKFAGDIGEASDSGLESDTDLAHSPDIVPDMDFESHRRRSNTAVRLDKLKKEKHKQSKIKHVPWREADDTVDEISEYFVKRDVVRQESSEKSKRVSALSMQLEEFNSSPNPFSEYAKFDGKTSIGQQTKKIAIFVTMQDEDERAYPMTVMPLTMAKVQDLIGLICWQYIIEEREPPLRDKVDSYALHIAEDDGEVDLDFPALDNREPISKFDFAKLALVEKNIPAQPSLDSSIVVTINLPHRGFSKIPLESDTVPMSVILATILEKRKLVQDKGRQYMLEKQSEPGVFVDLDASLSAMGTLEFCLIRENSARGDLEEEDIPLGGASVSDTFSSHQYRSYIVNMYSKFKTKTEVQLGISGEKLEIDPVSSSKGVLSVKHKASTYDIQAVADCLHLGEKSSGKSSFRLVYQSHHGDIKNHDFECDGATAHEIVQKMTHILEMRSGHVRKEYMERKRRQIQKRYTFRF